MFPRIFRQASRLGVVALVASTSLAATAAVPSKSTYLATKPAKANPVYDKHGRLMPAHLVALAQRMAAKSPVAQNFLANLKGATPTKATKGPGGLIGRQMEQASIAKSLAQFRAAHPKAAGQPSNNPTTPSSTATQANLPPFYGSPFFSTGISSKSPDLSPTELSFSMDANKDGKMDLVTIQESGTVHTVLNPGTGVQKGVARQAAPQVLNNTDVSDFGEFTWAQMVDINGDGYPDLVVMALDADPQGIFIYINQQDGSFRMQNAFPIDFTYNSVWSDGGGSMAVGDVNGDHIPDIIVYGTVQGYVEPDPPVAPATQYNGTYVEEQVFFGDGQGNFAPTLPETATFLHNYDVSILPEGGVTLVDMDNDGKLDAVVSAVGTDPDGIPFTFVTVQKGNGDGTFAAPLTGTTGTIANFDDMWDTEDVVADLNADGFPDVLLGSAESEAQDFSELVVALGSATGLGPFSTALANINENLFQVADANGDGKPDLLLENDGSIQVFPGNGDGTFAQSSSVAIGTGDWGYIEPQPADFDGDGKLDLASVDYDGGFGSIAFGTGSGFVGTQTVGQPGAVLNDLYLLANGDFDGDGKPDALYEYYDNDTNTDHFYTALNQGPDSSTHLPTFKYVESLPSSVVMSTFDYYVVLGATDLTNDGKADVVLQSGNSGTLYLLHGNGDGTFSTPAVLGSTNYACYMYGIDFGKLHNASSVDVVMTYPGDGSCTEGESNSGYLTLLNDGTGNFTSQFTQVGDQLAEVKLADLNNDGNLDLVLSDMGNRTLNVAQGNGDGTFGSLSGSLVYEAWINSLVATDLNGDGIADIAYTEENEEYNSDYTWHDVVFFQGNGDFTFNQVGSYAHGLVGEAIQAADLNGDGYPELVMAYDSGGDDYSTSADYAVTVGFAQSGVGILPNLAGKGFGTLVPAAQIGYLDSGPSTEDQSLWLADYNGDGAIDILAQNGDSVSLLTSLGAVALSLNSSSTTVDQDAPVTLTATLTPTMGYQVPAGSVSFFDNGVLLGTSPVSNNSATLTVNSLGVGSNNITAKYSGDPNFNTASASTPLSVAVATAAPNFTLTAPSSTDLKLIEGQTGIVSFTLTGNSTFNGAVNLACTGAPAQSTCTITPNTVTLNGVQSTTFSVVVTTTAPNNHEEAGAILPTWFNTAGGITLAGGVLLIGFGRRRKLSSTWGAVALLGLGIGATLTMTGCDHKYSGTGATTSSLTVTATSGSITQTQTINLTVTK